jgi:AcrR family transcriptional regulator
MPGMTKRDNVSRQDWIDAACDLLAEEGIDAVQVKTLAKRLGTSRSGFYWHFANRPALLTAMLDHWNDETMVATKRYMATHLEDPMQRLQYLAESCTGNTIARHERAIRAWAAVDATVAKVVKRVDRQRYRYAQSLFEALGFELAEARLRADIFVLDIHARPVFLGGLSRAERTRSLERRLAILTDKH